MIGLKENPENGQTENERDKNSEEGGDGSSGCGEGGGDGGGGGGSSGSNGGGGRRKWLIRIANYSSRSGGRGEAKAKGG